MSDLNTLIAKSIKSADTSWFSEDYSKQAQAVLAELRRTGWHLCPKEAPDALVEFAIDNIPFGRMKPEDMVKEMYKLLVHNARHYMK